jgi:hypothetical protein
MRPWIIRWQVRINRVTGSSDLVAGSVPREPVTHKSRASAARVGVLSAPAWRNASPLWRGSSVQAKVDHDRK